MTRSAFSAAVAFCMLAAPAVAQEPKRDLVVATSQADAGKLDPHLASAGADKGVLNWVFNALVRIRPGETSPEFIEPDLAESWTSSANGTEWTFTLRQGVECHGGYGEFTAEDAVYSIRRAANKETSAFSGDFAALDRVEAPDPYTVKVTLKTPIPSLLGLLSNYHGGLMVCGKAAEKLGADFSTHPIGTGPFEFVEYLPQQYIKLKANVAYFRGTPQLDTVTYRYIPSDATRDLAFQSGEVDMIFGRQNNQWVERTQAVPGAVVVGMEPAELNSLYLNKTVKPLDDIRVRQAIAHAIDRKLMVAFTGDKVAREAISVVPDGNLGVVDAGLFPYDPEKAKALLAEAGYPDGITLKTIQSSLPVLLKIMETLQADLKKSNITLDMQVVDHPTYMADIRKDLSQVTLYQAARFPVADVYLTQFFHSRSTVNTPGGVVNFSHCDAADAEIDAAKRELDPVKQKQLWKTAQEKIVADVCAVPFSEQLVVWAWNGALDLGYDLQGSLNLVPQLTEQTHFTK
ncbi:ABC transporter substrate-binding protein [Shinella yambaruensis]|uniref:ABC transporter substrate-binding protein n=1 Tax=Shinella yambaruensis TaxID=415996 RepID=A0ABQ5ZPL0_9HYPH|nr:ABC transporter substrate-binding protein [Shinella yambaruensis]GLR53585.1 ABC transporter substrate-binding protein [Shinella yambaruensis]